MNFDCIINIIHSKEATLFTHHVPHCGSRLLVVDVMTATVLISGAGLQFITIHFNSSLAILHLILTITVYYQCFNFNNLSLLVCLN